ncbi:AP-3 complex subunit sigma-2 [Clydaea vesicula]|uniref:AP-3 complex subunit sigma-2 n=1 Tax=Clydaea vesicula TaxID=447962 RepID=A0AAD5U4R9_9FUNG|nr:AP-3 complex subunit sigma-2 [Clydaea vesicula]
MSFKDIQTQQSMLKEIFALVSKRTSQQCNFLDGTALLGDDIRIIYRNFASMNLLQSKSVYRLFTNVCELDLIFRPEEVNHLLMEVISGGMVLETSISEIMAMNDIKKIPKGVARRSNVILHSISKRSISSVSGIETRWTKMPECEQGAVADFLAEKQAGDWKLMTLEEKRAAYFIAFGNYGSRTPPNPAYKYRVMSWVAGIFGLSVVCWQLWIAKMNPKKKTMSAEWEAVRIANAAEGRHNPFTGENKRI